MTKYVRDNIFKFILLKFSLVFHFVNFTFLKTILYIKEKNNKKSKKVINN